LTLCPEQKEIAYVMGAGTTIEQNIGLPLVRPALRELGAGSGTPDVIVKPGFLEGVLKTTPRSRLFYFFGKLKGGNHEG
jgi:hypothetical protein